MVKVKYIIIFFINIALLIVKNFLRSETYTIFFQREVTCFNIQLLPI